MATSTLRNCVSIYLRVCLHFGFVYTFARLPYFLQWFCALLNWVFFGHYACLLLFDVCRVLSVSIARFFVDLRRFGFLFVALQTLRDWYFAICFPFTSFELFFADFFCLFRTVDFACGLLPFYIVFAYPSYTIICLFVCVILLSFAFDMQLLDCLIFYNRFVNHFIVLFGQISHIYFLVFLQVFAGTTSSAFVFFLPFYLPFCYSEGFRSLSFYVSLSFCACCWILYGFLANFVVSFFVCNLWPSVDIFVCPCFAVSCCLPVSFLAFSLLQCIDCVNRPPHFLFISPLDPPCTPQSCL